MTFTFQKAQRNKAKLRLAITGPSGSGKTWGALAIAKGLGGKVAVLDSERDSAALYAKNFDFDTAPIDAPYTPERYIEAIQAAEAAGIDVLILDSITHEWSGKGGCLEINDEYARAKCQGNTWSAWAKTTPRHNKFIAAMMDSKMHIIATMRSKTETAQVSDGGKTRVIKLGMSPEQRTSMDYEFTLVLDLVHDGHFANASKDRTGLFSDAAPVMITEKTGAMLLAWLNDGEEMPQNTGMPREKMSEALTDMATSTTLEGLVTAYKTWYLVARNQFNDEAAQATLKAEWDKLNPPLQPQQPAEQPQ